MRRHFIALRLLPVLSWALALGYWVLYRQVPFRYFIYLTALPVIFASTVVTLAGRFKLWSWAEPKWVPSLIWGGYGGLHFVLLGDRIMAPMGVASLLECGLAGAATWGMIATLFDMFAMDLGSITVYNYAHHKKLGVVSIVGSYGLYFFGFYGFLSGIVTKLGYASIVDGRYGVSLLATTLWSAVCLAAPYLLFVLALGSYKRSRRQRAAPMLKRA
jgi:uncharacterized membrane protein